MATRVRRSRMAARATVVDFVAARERKRFESCRGRIRLLLEEHRRTLTDMLQTGLMFTRHGTRIASDLLRAQQSLLRAQDMLTRESRQREHEQSPSPEVKGVLTDVEEILERSSSTVKRHRSIFEPD